LDEAVWFLPPFGTKLLQTASGASEGVPNRAYDVQKKQQKTLFHLSLANYAISTNDKTLAYPTSLEGLQYLI
jgi:hypothetical protein